MFGLNFVSERTSFHRNARVYAHCILATMRMFPLTLPTFLNLLNFRENESLYLSPMPMPTINKALHSGKSDQAPKPKKRPTSILSRRKVSKYIYILYVTMCF